MIVDVHAHLDHSLVKDRLDEVIDNAKKAGVKSIITCGINHETNLIALEISKKHKDIVRCAFGLYPRDAFTREEIDNAYKSDSHSIDEELKFFEKHKTDIIAIGEVGLDYYNGKDKVLQENDFVKIIHLAKKLDKPLIIHSRKAESDALDILEREGAKKVVMHCFSGKKSLVARAAKLGYYFSIPTNIVRAENFQLIVKEINISQLLTETDTPYLSPFKDKRNEPAFIVETIKKIAEIKCMTEQDVMQNIYMNYQKLFL